MDAMIIMIDGHCDLTRIVYLRPGYDTTRIDDMTDRFWLAHTYGRLLSFALLDVFVSFVLLPAL